MLDQLGIDFKWLIGVAGAAIVAAFKYIHSRIVALETAVQANGSKTEEAHKQENDKLWDALDRHRSEFTNFKDRVLSENATKSDLGAMEKRIMTAIERAGR
jgi:hypothetical protein